MSATVIAPETLQFLKDLRENNNKEWFGLHKATYDLAHDNMKVFAQDLQARMLTHDRIVAERPGHNLYRIYNDLRFHKNKPPFNTRFAGGFHRIKPALRGGYYFHVEPGNSYVSAGFYGPNAADLKRIREDIADNFEEWQEILDAPGIQQTFGKMQGDQLKTAPVGFPKDHPAVELLRYKQFILRRFFTDAEVVAPDFVVQANASLQAIRPFFDYMSEMLTTDGNGLPLY
ncbi:MAG: DUF2461 domain-containing protein [Bacteroidetes bacterium]|nr:DUF2461 domain-containing protein [Bacteroidota bacterium]